MTEAAVTEAALEAPEPTVVQKLAAEVLGTFVLVFFGCSAILAMQLKTQSVDYVGIALAFGVAVLAMAYAVGNISGGHFNPAVSLGAALAGRLSWKNFGLYVAAQLVGAIGAGLVLFLVVGLYGNDFGSASHVLAGVSTTWDNSAGGAAWLAAFLLEVIGTFMFLMVILGVTDGRRAGQNVPAPLAIGLTLALIHLALVGFTGSSVNPARSLGTALFGGGDALKYIWLYLLAPFIGAAIAGLLYPALFGRETPVPGSGLRPGSASSSVGAGFSEQWQQQPGGHQSTAQQQAVQQQAAQQQPIIQDGWQWDPATQQWIPAQQQAAPANPSQGEWAPHDNPGGEHTIVRPPQ
jgi:aquaporin Z